MGSYKIFITAILCLFSTFTFAAIDPLLQQQRNQAEYASNMRAAVERYDQSVESRVLRNQLANQINGTVSAAATVSDGSKVSSVSTIAKVADSSAASSTILNRALKSPFLKGSAQSFVGAAAFAGLMKLLDINQDQDHKFYQTPNPNDFTDPQNVQQGWVYLQPNFYTNYVAALNSILTSYNLTADKVNYYDISADHACADFRKNDGSWVVGGCVNYKVNSNYDPTKPGLDLNPKQLTQDQLLSKIIDYLQKNPTSDITNNIYIDAYSPDKSFSLSDDSVNALASAIGKQVADNIAAAAQNPSGKSTTTLSDGTTVDTQIDTTGKTGTTSNTSTTTPNPDGTTTTTSSGSLQFPSFCSWASIMCDWYTWTKTTYDSVVTAVTDFLTPNNNDNTVDLQDPQPDDSNFSFSLPSACPAPVQLIDSSFMGVPINWQYDFADFCTILSDYVRPILIAMGAFIAVLILGGVRTTDD